MKKYALTTLSLVLCFFILTSFETMTTKGKPKKQKSGVTLTNLDRTVLPNVDFYQFASELIKIDIGQDGPVQIGQGHAGFLFFGLSFGSHSFKTRENKKTKYQ